MSGKPKEKRSVSDKGKMNKKVASGKPIVGKPALRSSGPVDPAPIVAAAPPKAKKASQQEAKVDADPAGDDAKHDEQLDEQADEQGDRDLALAMAAADAAAANIAPGADIAHIVAAAIQAALSNSHSGTRFQPPSSHPIAKKLGRLTDDDKLSSHLSGFGPLKWLRDLDQTMRPLLRTSSEHNPTLTREFMADYIIRVADGPLQSFVKQPVRARGSSVSVDLARTWPTWDAAYKALRDKVYTNERVAAVQRALDNLKMQGTDFTGLLTQIGVLIDLRGTPADRVDETRLATLLRAVPVSWFNTIEAQYLGNRGSLYDQTDPELVISWFTAELERLKLSSKQTQQADQAARAKVAAVGTSEGEAQATVASASSNDQGSRKPRQQYGSTPGGSAPRPKLSPEERAKRREAFADNLLKYDSRFANTDKATVLERLAAGMCAACGKKHALSSCSPAQSN